MSIEIKKMRQGMSYSCKEKTIILNVFKYFKMQFPDKCVTDLVRRTAKATGCSEKSIFQFRKEEASVEGFKSPSKTKIRKNININSRDIKYDESVRQAIRNIVYDLKYKNIIPSLNTILKNVHANTQLPNFSLMTLRRLLFDMGFSYEKSGNKSILIEKTEEKTDSGKNKKAKINPSSAQGAKIKLHEVNKVVEPVNNSHNAHEPANNLHSLHPVPTNSNIVQINHLPKPTPQHPVINMNNSTNLHLGHMGQPFDYQNHHHPLVATQGPPQNHSHSMMGPPMHSQPPLPHNMPMMLNHRRPPPHSSHIVPPPFEMHLRREDFPLGV